MTDRTPTTLDAAWEALHVDLTNAWQNEGPTYYENILARHRPRIEAEARAEVTDDKTTAYMVGYEQGKAEARALLDVERLRVALERAIEAMDLVRDGLAVRSTDAIVIGEESILRHAAREARAALEEPTP